MEFLEAVGLFHRGNYGIFHRTAVHFRIYWRTFLPACIYHDHLYHSAKADLWGSRVRLAFHGLHHFDDQWRTVFLHRNPGPVFGKNLFGSEAQTHLRCKRGDVKKRPSTDISPFFGERIEKRKVTSNSAMKEYCIIRRLWYNCHCSRKNKAIID